MLVAGSFWSLAHVSNQYLNTRFKLYHLSFFLLTSNIVLWYLAFHNPRVSSLQHVTEPGLTRALTKGEFTRSPWSHARHFCRGPYIFLHTRNTDEKKQILQGEILNDLGIKRIYNIYNMQELKDSPTTNAFSALFFSMNYRDDFKAF